MYTGTYKKGYWFFVLTLAAATALAPLPQRVYAADDANWVQPVDMTVDPAAAGGPVLVVNQTTTPVAPGVTMISFDRLDLRGWSRVHYLQVDLGSDGVRTGLLYPGVLAKAEPLSQLASRAGAVGAVNGDFFDIRNTKIPLGVAMADGQWLKSAPATTPAGGVGVDGLGKVAGAVLQAQVILPGGPQPLAAMNQYTVPENGIGLYTPVWGDVPFAGAAYGAAQAKVVTVTGGKVSAIANQVTPGLLAPDNFVLVGREAGAAALGALKVGDPVSVQFAPAAYDWAIGGEVVLLAGGQVAPGLDDLETGPRTAVGFSADGKTMYVAQVDGRQGHSRGLTRQEMAVQMQRLGATQAIGLDGGGSSELVARTPGLPLSVINSPSDGTERYVANGIGIFAQPGSGKAVGARVMPAGTEGSAVGLVAATEATSRLNRVFPGTVRQLSARVYDETYGPVAQPAPFLWTATAGAVTSTGLFIAPATPGKVTVTATSGDAKGRTDLQVLGDLDRIVVEPSTLTLTVGGTASFQVIGYDAEGRSAPIDPMNISVSYDTPVVSFPSTTDGTMKARGAADGAALVRVRVKGKEALLGVSVGYTADNVSGLETPAAWAYSAFPVGLPGAVTAGVGAGGGSALRLAYDFSQPGATGTRAAYIQAAGAPLALPGQPNRLGVWVKGDGNGAWLRAVLQDAAGKTYTVDLAKQVTWKDWRYVEVSLPGGMAYPVGLQRIYPVETDKTRLYTGELLFAGMIVKTPNRVEVPAPVEPADTLAASLPDALAGKRLRAALVFDGAKLADAQATKPAAVLTLGAVTSAAGGAASGTAGGQATVGGGQAAAGGGQVALAAGAAPVVNLLAAPGRKYDLGGTRFLALDSAAGIPRATDMAQWLAIRTALDQAAADATVKNVVIVTQLAPGRWSDAREAQLLEQWLEAFREQSGGKGAALVAGGGPGAARFEGVGYLYAGAWSDLRVATGLSGGDWLRWQSGAR